MSTPGSSHSFEGASSAEHLAPFLRADWRTPPIEGRRTKIVCTLGPATQSLEKIEELLVAGMNVCRLNFSHGSHEYHAKTIANVREVCEKTRRVCAILLDTKGPEIRTGKLEGGKDIRVRAGDNIIVTTDQSEPGNQDRLTVDYKNLPIVMEVGGSILVDDGLVALTVVEKISESDLLCVVENSGAIGETKGVNLPGVVVDLPALMEKDVEDILFGVEQGVDIIAASFIRKATDIQEIRDVIGHEGEHIKIIAKIENQEGLDNFQDILEVADGIMIARGDLGVEIPIEKVGLAQKMMTLSCNAVGKPVITATQMLETMITNPRPTRAEASDVTNAVLDGTDAVMLSGETAKGAYPVEAVKIMASICLNAESAFDYKLAFEKVRRHLATQTMTVVDALTAAAVTTANDLRAGLIITLTETGNTARLVAKYRPHAPIFCITSHKDVGRQLLLSRSVFPVVVGTLVGVDNVIARTIDMAKRKNVVKSGDFVVVTSGMKTGPSGLSNIMKVMVVD